MTVIFTQGIQGSGKSTWAKEQAKISTFKRVNRDDIRLMLDNIAFDKSNEAFVTVVEDTIIHKALQHGYSVIIDAMNLNKVFMDKKISSIKQEFPEVHIKTVQFFDVPLSECILRDSKRENPLGAKIITDTYNKYEKVINEL